MQFANPIWLWALCGLLIPIGIHLFSRQEGKVIPMGSLRYLRESPTARYKNIRLNEIALLLLRCILITLLVLLLAGAGIPWSPQQKNKWILVEPGIQKSDEIKPLIEELQREGFELRSLARNFPPLSDKSNTEPVANYWSVAKELASRPLDSVVVISYNYQRNFRGERIAMPPRIKWLAYPADARAFIAEIFPVATDSIRLRKANTSSFVTRYETDIASSLTLPDSLQIKQPEVLQIAIITGEGFGYDEKIIRASLGAIQSITPHKLNITTRNMEESEKSGADIIFWLADEPPSIYGSNKTIAYRPCNAANLPLLIASGKAMNQCRVPENVSWVITKRLNEKMALREHLTLHLARLVLPPSTDDNIDQRVLPERMMWSSVKSAISQSIVKKETRDTSLLITILFVLLLLAERAVAFTRNQ